MSLQEDIRVLVKDQLKRYEGTQIDAAVCNTLSIDVAEKVNQRLEGVVWDDDPSYMGADDVFEHVRTTLATRIRDWIHEQPWSLCDSRADTCPDWDKAYEIADIVLGVKSVAIEKMRTVDPPAALRAMQAATHPEKIVIQIGEFFYWALRQWNNKYEMDPNPHPEFNVRGFPFHHWPGIEGKTIVWECPNCGEKHPKESETARIDCVCGHQQRFPAYGKVNVVVRNFSDWAEPFCAGWNSHKENGDVAAADFVEILMDRFRNSGPQRAKRAVTEMEREELRRRLERDLP